MVSLDMTKGEKIALTKDNPGLTEIFVGAGWNPNKNKSASKFDLDLFAFLLRNKKLVDGKDVIYFKNMKHSSDSIFLNKDNLTGEGEGDDEVINTNLAKIPTDVTEIIFGINIYQAVDKKQNFGMVDETHIRIVNAKDNKEILKYNPSEDYSTNTGLIAMKLYRDGTEWKVQAIGEGKNGAIADIATAFQ